MEGDTIDKDNLIVKKPKVESKGELQRNCTIASLVVSMLVLMVAIITLVFVILANKRSLGDREETVVDKIIKNIMSGTLSFVLPSKFSISKDYIMPPSDQMSRGTCWAFSAINLLEGQYRHQGIKSGYLKENEYVNFSKQALGAWLGQQCEKSPGKSKACKHGGFASHSTNDHKADSFYYFAQDFPELTKSILPESVCPYFKEASATTDYQCDGMDEAIKTNPIEFKIKGIRSASDVYNTKKLLVEAQRTLVIGTPLAELVYNAPCTSEAWKDDEMCNAKNRKVCPHGYQSEFCANIMIPGRANDGTFLLIDDYNRTAKWGGHAMNIVGYNDDWVYHNRHVTDLSVANLRGGFVLHNSWRNQGHSFEYLMGRRSEENEAVICPNHQISTNWIPATLKCVTDHGGKLDECGTEYKFVRGRGITKHADKLKCLNAKYCDVNRSYVLSKREDIQHEDIWMQHLFTGLDRVRLISFNKDGSDIKYEFFEKFPFHYLSQAFGPVDEELIENDLHQCGYYMMPYQVIQMMNRKNWAKLDNYHVSDIEVEFTPSSYLRGPGSNKFNTDILKASTWIMNETEFEGPLPYNYVY